MVSYHGLEIRNNVVRKYHGSKEPHYAAIRVALGPAAFRGHLGTYGRHDLLRETS
jgi:hypothetical protein